MAKLYARLGTMGSGKSMQLLSVAKNYELQNKDVILLTSGIDNREGVGRVNSRIGIAQDAFPIYNSTNILHLLKRSFFAKLDVSCILVDEVQFFEPHHIEELAEIVDKQDIPVIAYGLRTDFRGCLFDGTKRLLELADSIEEIKTTCVFCNKKSIMNLRTLDGVPVYNGEQVQIGDSEYYSVCREHYFNPPLEL